MTENQPDYSQIGKTGGARWREQNPTVPNDALVPVLAVVDLRAEDVTRHPALAFHLIIQVWGADLKGGAKLERIVVRATSSKRRALRREGAKLAQKHDMIAGFRGDNEFWTGKRKGGGCLKLLVADCMHGAARAARTCRGQCFIPDPPQSATTSPAEEVKVTEQPVAQVGPGRVPMAMAAALAAMTMGGRRK